MRTVAAIREFDTPQREIQSCSISYHIVEIFQCIYSWQRGTCAYKLERPA